MIIDSKKKYRTRGGSEVTGLSRNSKSSKYPWVGAVNGKELWWAYDGSWIIGAASPLDIVEVIPEPPAFDPTKPVMTREGCKAGIYSADNPGSYPIHGWVEHVNGSRVVAGWTRTGRFLDGSTPSISDLVNIPPPPPLTGYVNVYPRGGIGAPRLTRAKADEAGAGRIACIKWTEGQFDE